MNRILNEGTAVSLCNTKKQEYTYWSPLHWTEIQGKQEKEESSLTACSLTQIIRFLFLVFCSMQWASCYCKTRGSCSFVQDKEKGKYPSQHKRNIVTFLKQFRILSLFDWIFFFSHCRESNFFFFFFPLILEVSHHFYFYYYYNFFFVILMIFFILVLFLFLFLLLFIFLFHH